MAGFVGSRQRGSGGLRVYDIVAIKNDLDVFYFAAIVPLLVFFHESGQMEKREFLDMWKEIPEQNEQQFTIQNTQNLSAGSLLQRFLKTICVIDIS
ncbi:unnamed protein product [Angiostrongylus costaricensis]|uniref:B2-adapt-app_C domain-containing protein n=1 Tax=Angiostrongylus costaricensis TaxID=334426 RepID=A0A0R3PB24_ANGCS|nr:unnamed protein product [Angiostrongylus costaricensis]